MNDFYIVDRKNNHFSKPAEIKQEPVGCASDTRMPEYIPLIALNVLPPDRVMQSTFAEAEN